MAKKGALCQGFSLTFTSIFNTIMVTLHFVQQQGEAKINYEVSLWGNYYEGNKVCDFLMLVKLWSLLWQDKRR